MDGSQAGVMVLVISALGWGFVVGRDPPPPFPHGLMPRIVTQRRVAVGVGA